MDNLRIGHATDLNHGTGVSVFLFPEGAIGAYIICGSAPASHELAVLDPDSSVPKLYGLMFAGGSAFGLAAVQGVLQYLSEQNIGHATRVKPVPIVPAACIYDLAFKSSQPPQAEQAYAACISAQQNNLLRGRIGAGTGATVGKIVPDMRLMSGGFGQAQLVLSNGVKVSAFAVVNSVGDVYNEAGQIIAGAQMPSGQFVDANQYLLSGKAEIDLFSQSQSTLVAVCTTARFSKDALKRISKMIIAGIARTVYPVFTPYDGDIVFMISVAEESASELSVGALAAQAVQLAIRDAVKDAQVIL